MSQTIQPDAPGVHPYLVLFGGIMAISTGAIFARIADAPSLVIAAYRVGIASLLLAPIALFKSFDAFSQLTRKDVQQVVLAGAFLAMHFATWISSLKFTTIANSVVLVNMSPLWVGILAPLLTKEKTHPSMRVSIVLSIVGCVVIGSGDLVLGAHALWGDFLALLGGICTAGYLMLGKRIRQKHSLIVYVSLCYGSAAVFLWAIVLLLGLQITGFSGQTTAAFWGMALISQIIGHSCYNWALRYCSTAFVALGLLGEPIGSTLLAYVLFHEGLTPAKSVGGLLILAAIYLAARSEHQ